MKQFAILPLVCGVTFGCDSLSLDPDRASAPVVALCAVGESAADKGVVTAEKTIAQMTAEELWDELRIKYITQQKGTTIVNVEFNLSAAEQAFNGQNVDAKIMRGVIELIDTWRKENNRKLSITYCTIADVESAVLSLTKKRFVGFQCSQTVQSIRACLDSIKGFLNHRIELFRKDMVAKAQLEEAEKRAEERVKQEEEKRKQVEAELAAVKAVLAALRF